MAAFRLGQIEDCHDILVDVVQVPKLRETLAQSLSRGIDRAEMDKDELKR